MASDILDNILKQNYLISLYIEDLILLNNIKYHIQNLNQTYLIKNFIFLELLYFLYIFIKSFIR